MKKPKRKFWKWLRLRRWFNKPKPLPQGKHQLRVIKSTVVHGHGETPYLIIEAEKDERKR